MGAGGLDIRKRVPAASSRNAGTFVVSIVIIIFRLRMAKVSSWFRYPCRGLKRKRVEETCAMAVKKVEKDAASRGDRDRVRASLMAP